MMARAKSIEGAVERAGGGCRVAGMRNGSAVARAAWVSGAGLGSMVSAGVVTGL